MKLMVWMKSLLWKWKKKMKIKICVVCSGNICRSPFVEYVLKKELGKSYKIFSAGLLGIYKQPAYEVCVALAPQFGIKLSKHKSQGVTGENIEDCDYVLAMTQAHLEGLTVYPSKIKPLLMSEFLNQEKTYDLGDLGLIKQGDDIPDPMGQNADIVEPVLQLLEDAAILFAEKIKKK